MSLTATDRRIADEDQSILREISRLQERRAVLTRIRARRRDPRIIFPDDVEALRALGNEAGFSNETARLAAASLVDTTLYRVHANPASRVAAAGIYEGGHIRVSNEYHIEMLRGRFGTVERVASSPSGVRIEVRMDVLKDIRPEVTVCFYEARESLSARSQAVSSRHIVSTTPMPEEGGMWSGHRADSAQNHETRFLPKTSVLNFGEAQ